MLAPRATGETIHSDVDWFVRRDGTMFPVSYWSAPIETPKGRGAVVAFIDIEVQRNVERAMREREVAEVRAAEARAAQRRTIEAADAARRQVTRDLHDGAQAAVRQRPQQPATGPAELGVTAGPREGAGRFRPHSRRRPASTASASSPRASIPCS